MYVTNHEQVGTELIVYFHKVNERVATSRSNCVHANSAQFFINQEKNVERAEKIV